MHCLASRRRKAKSSGYKDDEGCQGADRKQAKVSVIDTLAPAQTLGPILLPSVASTFALPGDADDLQNIAVEVGTQVLQLWMLHTPVQSWQPLDLFLGG